MKRMIVGLGNPGKEYEATRHNYGFLAVDALLRTCERYGAVKKISGQKDSFHLWKFTQSNNEWLITTPLTYMNKSGDAVQGIANYYHIPPESILVMHDELDIPLGRMKVKIGGGHAGHNGIRSIQQMLATPEFYRMRLGIGKPAGYDTASFVLGKFSQSEKKIVDETLAAVVDGVFIFIEKGLIPAQQFCNSFSAEPAI